VIRLYSLSQVILALIGAFVLWVLPLSLLSKIFYTLLITGFTVFKIFGVLYFAKFLNLKKLFFFRLVKKRLKKMKTPYTIHILEKFPGRKDC